MTAATEPAPAGRVLVVITQEGQRLAFPWEQAGAAEAVADEVCYRMACSLASALLGHKGTSARSACVMRSAAPGEEGQGGQVVEREVPLADVAPATAEELEAFRRGGATFPGPAGQGVRP